VLANLAGPAGRAREPDCLGAPGIAQCWRPIRVARISRRRPVRGAVADRAYSVLHIVHVSERKAAGLVGVPGMNRSRSDGWPCDSPQSPVPRPVGRSGHAAPNRHTSLPSGALRCRSTVAPRAPRQDPGHDLRTRPSIWRECMRGLAICRERSRLGARPSGWQDVSPCL